MSETRGALRLLLTGGGTGGHLFPAVAAAQELRRRQPDSAVLFIGTTRKMDAAGLAASGFAGAGIISYGVKGKNPFELLKALLALPVSLAQAIGHIRRFRPDVTLGVGGYVTGAVMTAARLLRVPTVIHEQNSVPGMANRKLGGLVDRICLSLPGTSQYFPEWKTVLTGNPVRESILALAQQPRALKDRPTLLVLGGSQGAQAINRLVAEAFCQTAREALAGVRLLHQTGATDAEPLRRQYAAAGVDATVAAFFQDMATVYGQADFCVSRAGATTLAELAVLGLPAVLIPYPYAADNHQESNARYYQQDGGAIVCREKEIDSSQLADMLIELAGDQSRRQQMGLAMQQLAQPQAAASIIDICLQMVNRS